MANSKSAIKRWRQSIKRRNENRLSRTLARTRVRQVRDTVASGDTELSEAQLSEAYSALDRAARKGTIHQRNADRRKRRLAALVARAK